MSKSKGSRGSDSRDLLAWRRRAALRRGSAASPQTSDAPRAMVRQALREMYR